MRAATKTATNFTIVPNPIPGVGLVGILVEVRAIVTLDS